MFQESTNPSIQEKVKKLVDVYGRAVLTHIVFRENYKNMGWGRRRFCMNANPEKAIEIIAGICKENGQDPTLRSNFEMMVWDQEKNVKFIVLVYMMEEVDDWRVLVELQSVTGLGAQGIFKNLYQCLCERNLVCSDSYEWFIENNLAGPFWAHKKDAVNPMA